MTTDTPAPRFTAEQYLAEADRHCEMTVSTGILINPANSNYVRAMLIQAAADLASAPTREELAYAVWLFTHPKTTIKQFYKATANQKGSAYRRADALLKAGVRVRG